MKAERKSWLVMETSMYSIDSTKVIFLLNVGIVKRLYRARPECTPATER